MNENWTPLFSGLVLSSVWKLDDTTRIVWITMLALKDYSGVVSCSLPGLASLAGKSIDETVKALEVLAAPDPMSRNQDNEGRRIKEIEHCKWKILNHEYYRDKMASEKRRAYQAKKQREYRTNKPSQCPHVNEEAVG